MKFSAIHLLYVKTHSSLLNRIGLGYVFFEIRWVNDHVSPGRYHLLSTISSAPGASSSLFRLVSVYVIIIPSSSSMIRPGTSFHAGRTSNISSAATSASLSSYWISDWILLCIPSLPAFPSGSSGRIGMSRSCSGYNSGPLWSSDGSLTNILC